MYEFPYVVECLLALARELPSFIELIVRHIVEIIKAV